MIEIITTIIALFFLVRTFKVPMIKLSESFRDEPNCMYSIFMYLFGSIGFYNSFYLLPLFIICIISYMSKRNGTDNIASMIVVPISYMTGLTRLSNFDDTILHTLIKKFIIESPLLSTTATTIIILLLFYTQKFPEHSGIIFLIYSFLFISTNKFSLELILLIFFISIGALIRKNEDDKPFLSFHIIESILCVGTLFSIYPLNLIFSICSIFIILFLSKIIDNTYKTPIINNNFGDFFKKTILENNNFEKINSESGSGFKKNKKNKKSVIDNIKDDQ